MQRTGTDAAIATFHYAGGGSEGVKIQVGIHLNGYQYNSEIKKGIVAWIGRTPKWGDATLWCWDITNPQPKKVVESVTLIATGPVSLALIAVTAER